MVQTGKPLITLISSAAVLISSFTFSTAAVAGSHADSVAEGKKIAFSRKKGNCLACHAIAGGQSPGNIAPPLVAMKQRYPERDKLYQQIWDATTANPDSSMPPFGKHMILNKSELNKVVDYIHTL